MHEQCVLPVRLSSGRKNGGAFHLLPGKADGGFPAGGRLCPRLVCAALPSLADGHPSPAISLFRQKAHGPVPASSWHGRRLLRPCSGRGASVAERKPGKALGLSCCLRGAAVPFSPPQKQKHCRGKRPTAGNKLQRSQPAFTCHAG